MKEIKCGTQGFTLLELLVVVLIIGILASIALPQYEMAVTKAKVASILPIMRRWKDALAEYKLQHGDYGNDDNGYPDGANLGVNWPSDWNDGECGDNTECWNDYWSECFANEEGDGAVYCETNDFYIKMYQYDEDNIILCRATEDYGNKVCKALGGKEIDEGYYQLF